MAEMSSNTLILTRHILRMLALWVIGCGLFVTAAMGIGSLNRTDVFAAPTRDSDERWIYLLDPERLIKLRILPRVDTRKITNIQPQWGVSPGRFYIRTLERGEDGIKRIDVLYLHDVLTGDTTRLISRSSDLYVGLPIDSPSSTSPDGRYITFVDYSRGDVYVLDVQTNEARHVIDISSYGLSSTPNGSTPRVIYSPFWGPDGRTMTYSWDDTLFLWRTDDEQPRTFQFPGKKVGFSFWSTDGKTLIVQSGESSNTAEMFAAHIDLDTNQVEVVMEDVGRTTWMCGDRFLTYNTLRDPDVGDQGEIEDDASTSTFVGHLVDTYSDTTLNLDDLPQFKGADHQNVWMYIYNCDETEWVMIQHRLDNDASGQNQPYVLPSSRLYAFYLLNTQTREVVKVADTAHTMYWRPDLKQYIYFAPGDQNTQVIHTFALSANAQPVKIGQFTPKNLSISPVPSHDFKYMIGIESGPSSGFDGRLVRIDVQTGEEVYLTPHNVFVGYPSRWD